MTETPDRPGEQGPPGDRPTEADGPASDGHRAEVRGPEPEPASGVVDPAATDPGSSGSGATGSAQESSDRTGPVARQPVGEQPDQTVPVTTPAHQRQAMPRVGVSPVGGSSTQGYGPPGQGPQAYGPPSQGAPAHGPPPYDPARGSAPQGYGAPGNGAPPAGHGPQTYGPPGYGNAPAGFAPQGHATPGYGPPGYGPPGYGPTGYGSPGYGPPGGGPPGFHTAPRPGIIPLRPLGIGDFFGAAFAYIRHNPAATLLPALVVAIVVQLVQFGAQGLLGVTSAATASPDLPGHLGRSFAASGIVALVGVVLSAVLAGVLITVLRGALVGRRTDAGTAWRGVASRVPGLLGVAVLTFLVIALIAIVGFGLSIGLGVAVGRGAGAAIGILLGVATLVALVYVAVLLSMATPAYVMEEIGVVAALHRSRALVRGAWWSVFGVLLLAALMFAVAGGALGAVVGAIGLATSATPGPLTPAAPGIGFTIATAVVAVLVTTFASPFLSGITGLLYVDQRIRRERFDLDLARAASN